MPLIRFVPLWLFVSMVSAPLMAQRPHDVLSGPEPVRRQPYDSYTTRDSLGRTVQFYLSEAGDRSLPLVVYVQGSGFSSHFVPAAPGYASATGHASLVDAARGRARVLLVEKPGVAFADPGHGDPSALFRREHTLERWSAAVLAAMGAARRLPGVDTTRLLIVGHSEGGIVAARLARRSPHVTHVALLAGEGPSQLHSLVALAREGALLESSGDTPDAREAAVRAAWDSIRRDPLNADRSWFGHAFPRWSSFLATSPIEQLDGVTARVLIVQGTADRAVWPATADSLHRVLRSGGVDVRLDMVDGADHSFRLASGEDRWGAVLSGVLDWGLAADRR